MNTAKLGDRGDQSDKNNFDIDTAIIGAGVHALTLTMYLLQKRKDLQEKILVFDPTENWLTQWHRQFAA